MVFGNLVDPISQKTIDQVLAVYFPGPGAFTGEDSAEIHGHGGSTVPRLILEALLASGARLARPGEFTLRAFLNSRLSLDQAEAVAELVASQSEAEAAIAARHLEGALAKKLEPTFAKLMEAAAFLTSELDFMDEDEWSEARSDHLLAILKDAQGDLERLLELRMTGRVFRDGLRVVLAGPPNAGKSSLFNALLGRDRALVNPMPGTTRDYLEGYVSWSGLKVELVDTAGLREDGDELESQGQALTQRELEQAEVIVWLNDLSKPETRMPPPVFSNPNGPKLIEVWNKADIGLGPPPAENPGHPDHPEKPYYRTISALTGQGLDGLKQDILGFFLTPTSLNPELVPNLRQQKALEEGLDYINATVKSLEDGQAPDIASLEIKGALEALGRITGRVLTEDLLEEVFSRFCLGK
jgi:tRNA modification GTPase